MGILAGVAYVDILPNLKGFGPALTRDISARQREIASRAGKTGLILSAGILAGAKVAINAASDLNESVSAVAVTFGEAGDAVLKWSKDTNDAFSQVQFNSAIKGYAVFGKAAGLANKANAEFSKGLVKAAGDLSSFHNADPSEVLDNIKSGLTGEAEPLRKYGILISQVNVEHEAMRLGLIKQGQAMTEGQKILARREIIMKSLGAAQGDWERTMDSAANQERLLAANSQDTAAALGKSLLPAYQSLLKVAQDTVNFFGAHEDVTKSLVIAVSALAAGLLIYSAAVKATIAVQMVYNTVFKATNATMTANPIGLVVVALAALVAGLIIAYKKSETFRRVVDATFEAVKRVVVTALKVIITHIQIYLKGIQLLLQAASHLPFVGDKIKVAADAMQSVIDKLGDLKGAMDGVNKSAAETVAQVDLLQDAHGRATESARRLASAHTAANKEVGNMGTKSVVTTKEIKKMVSALDTAKSVLSKLGDKAGSVFAVFSDKALQAFDAETERVLENLKVRVEALGRAWTMGVDDKTPAERELEALDKVEAKKDLAARREALKRDLKAASKSVDTEQEIGGKIFTFKQSVDREKIREINAELRKLDAEEDRNRLEARAARERKAADKAIARARLEYSSLRAVQKEHLEAQLSAMDEALRKGRLTQERFRQETAQMFEQYEIDLEGAGKRLGEAFATSLNISMQAVQTEAARTHSALMAVMDLAHDIALAKDSKTFARLAKQLAASMRNPRALPAFRDMPLAPGGGGMVPQLPTGQTIDSVIRQVVGYAKGGIAASDTVPALLSPGEMVLTKAHQAMLGGASSLRRVLGFAEGGIVPGTVKIYDGLDIHAGDSNKLMAEIAAWEEERSLAPSLEGATERNRTRFAVHMGQDAVRTARGRVDGGLQLWLDERWDEENPGLHEMESRLALARDANGNLIGAGSFHKLGSEMYGDYVGGVKGGGLAVFKAIIAEAAKEGIELLRFDAAPTADKLYKKLGIPEIGGAARYLEHDQIQALNKDFLALAPRSEAGEAKRRQKAFFKSLNLLDIDDEWAAFNAVYGGSDTGKAFSRPTELVKLLAKDKPKIIVQPKFSNPPTAEDLARTAETAKGDEPFRNGHLWTTNNYRKAASKWWKAHEGLDPPPDELLGGNSWDGEFVKWYKEYWKSHPALPTPPEIPSIPGLWDPHGNKVLMGEKGWTVDHMRELATLRGIIDPVFLELEGKAPHQRWSMWDNFGGSPGEGGYGPKSWRVPEFVMDVLEKIKKVHIYYVDALIRDATGNQQKYLVDNDPGYKYKGNLLPGLDKAGDYSKKVPRYPIIKDDSGYLNELRSEYALKGWLGEDVKARMEEKFPGLKLSEAELANLRSDMVDPTVKSLEGLLPQHFIKKLRDKATPSSGIGNVASSIHGKSWMTIPKWEWLNEEIQSWPEGWDRDAAGYAIEYMLNANTLGGMTDKLFLINSGKDGELIGAADMHIYGDRKFAELDFFGGKTNEGRLALIRQAAKYAATHGYDLRFPADSPEDTGLAELLVRLGVDSPFEITPKQAAKLVGELDSGKTASSGQDNFSKMPDLLAGKSGIFDPIAKKLPNGIFDLIPKKPANGIFDPIANLKLGGGLYNPIKTKDKSGLFNPLLRGLFGLGKGEDTVPAMLSPGEMVLNKVQQSLLGGALKKKGSVLAMSTGGIVPGMSIGGSSAFDLSRFSTAAGETQIIGQVVQNQYVTDESTALAIGSQAARKASRR